jgi:hypothetical protein
VTIEGRERAGARTWITEGRGGGKLQASRLKRCGDQGPTSEKNGSRDLQTMARASSSPRLCLPLLLLVVMAAVFVALPVAACASSSNEAAGDSASLGRKPATEAQKELLGEEGAPSQRRDAFTVGPSDRPPQSLALPHAHIMNPETVPPPAMWYHPATGLQ